MSASQAAFSEVCGGRAAAAAGITKLQAMPGAESSMCLRIQQTSPTQNEEGGCELGLVLRQQDKGVLGCRGPVLVAGEGPPQELRLLLVLRTPEQALQCA